MATPEAKVKAAVRRILGEYADKGVWYFFPAANGYGRAGIPDIIVCAGGNFVAIECKANGGKTTALQDKELQKIANAGGLAMVADETTLPNVRSLLDFVFDESGEKTS